MTDDRYGKIHTDGSRSGGQPLDDSIEEKALALLNEVSGLKDIAPYSYLPNNDVTKTLCRAIERHEAFKQEVSDAVTALLDRFLGDGLSQGVINGHLHSFIIPKPKPKPDSLVDVWGDLFIKSYNLDQFCDALEARGLEIKEKAHE
jgi:hypothetical protein